MNLKFNSIHIRVIFSTGCVLAVFFVLIAFALERSFQQSAELALREKLQIRIFSLLSAAELDASARLIISEPLPESRFANPGSGLFAFIANADQEIIWRSPSSIGHLLPAIPLIETGVFEFNRLNTGWYVLYYSVIWETQKGQDKHFLLVVTENARFINTEIFEFKTTLRSWLAAIGIILLVVLFFVLRWSLRPLRKIMSDLLAIEMGSIQRLEGQYASELRGLAGNLNTLISSERAHSKRYRNTLGDLAHSLKTPLSVMRGLLNTSTFSDNCRAELEEQIAKMNDIVEYQLHRAANKGKTQFTGTVDFAEVIRKTINSLDKVYAAKKIHVDVFMPKSFPVYYEEGDLYEVVGNILDNAYKWCNHLITIRIEMIELGKYSWFMQIEDDGPGLATDKISIILQRGVRADQNVDGHGIGMAVVQELVTLLDGRLEGGSSPKLGGMQWSVYLP